MDNDKLGIEITQQEIESFTRLLLPKIQQFFKREEGKENLPNGNENKLKMTQ